MLPKTFRYEGSRAKLVSIAPGLACLVDVWSEERGKGYGRKVMEQVIEYADKNNLNLILTAQQNSNGGLSNDELRIFYEKFGFRVPADATRRPWTMLRIPRSKHHI